MILRGIKYLTTLNLFKRTAEYETSWQIIAWWEARRVPYNLIVGVTGIFTSMSCLAAAAVGEKYLRVPIGLPDPPIFAIFSVIAYGVMANICYTGGWIAELIANKVWQDQAQRFGPITFTFGILFSIMLTLLPGVLVWGVLIINLLIHNVSVG